MADIGWPAAYGDDGRPLVAPPPADAMAVARQLLQDRTEKGELTLRAWRGGWMSWRGPHWAESQPGEVRAWAYAALEHAHYAVMTPQGPELVPWRPNRRKIADVMEALEAVTILPDRVNPPAWTDGGGRPPAGEIVSVANGLLHVRTRLLAGHEPGFFNLVSVPFGYAPDAPAPERWLKFLGELWPGDGESIAALQEWFGYVLSGRTDLHKILLVVGPRRGGKGTLARVLAALVGAANTAGPTLSSLGGEFGLAPLLGKPLAIVSDARLGGADTRVVVERLLSVSGEDRLTVNVKYRQQWTGTLPTRFVVMSNELPAFGDASGAIATRFVALVLTRSWLGSEDLNLSRDLLGELPGILNWSLDGLARLTAAGRLTEPQSSAEAVGALADLVSPVAAFVRDCCDRKGEVTVNDLYHGWRSWCEVNGHRPSSKQRFGRDLRAVVPALRVTQPRDETTGQQSERVYKGLSLRGTNNGPVRVSARVSDPREAVTRTDTRTNPMLSPREGGEPDDGAPPGDDEILF